MGALRVGGPEPRTEVLPPRSERPHVSRRELVIVSAIAVTGLVLRLWLVRDANLKSPAGIERLTGDEPGYDEFARQLQRGDWSQYPVRGPGYPALLAVFRGLTGGSYDAILYLQALVTTTAIPLTWMLGRRLFGPAAGLIAAGGVAAHWDLAADATRLHSEVLYTPLLVVFLILAIRFVDSPTVQLGIAAGAVLGVMNVTRPGAILFPVVAVVGLLWWCRRQRSRVLIPAVTLVAVSYLVVAPVTLANLVVYDQFLPVATSTGVLWQGSPEYYDLRADGATYLSIWENELNPAVNGGYWVGTIEGDRHFTERAVESIRDDPATYLLYSFQKAGWYWVGHPSADWANDTVLDPRSLTPYFSRPRVAMMMLARLLPVLAGLSLLYLWRRRALDRRAMAPVLAFVAYFWVLHALTWAEFRLSQPLAPVLWTLVGAGVAALAAVLGPKGWTHLVDRSMIAVEPSRPCDH